MGDLFFLQLIPRLFNAVNLNSSNQNQFFHGITVKPEVYEFANLMADFQTWGGLRAVIFTYFW